MGNDLKERRNGEERVDLRTLVLTTTVALFIIMMSFFIMLNTFATENQSKRLSLRDSLTQSFGFVNTGRGAAFSEEEGTGEVRKVESDTAAGLRAILPDLSFRTRTTAESVVMSVLVPRGMLDEQWDSLSARIASIMSEQKSTLQLLSLDGPQSAQRLAQMAADLNAQGVETDRLAVGYDSRGQSSFELQFVIPKR